VNGLTSANLGKPDYYLGIKQHQKYIDALIECGLDLTVLEADENYPDSIFVKDTTLLTPYSAIITNPCATSRNGEIVEMSQVIKNFYPNVESIAAPGTLEAGDVMMVEKHFYTGLSKRTNRNGANQ